MADSEKAISTAKKKNNRNRKKKNDSQKHTNKNPTETGSAKGGSIVKDRVDTKPMPNISANEGSSFAITERKITRWEDSRQRNIQPAKKKDNSTKKFNTSKMDTHSTSQQHPMTGESSRKIENTRDYRNYREERNSFNQMGMLNRQIEGERKRKWLEYFFTKPHDLLLLDRNNVILLKTVEKSRPQAQFFCRVCNYYCDNMSVVGTHIRKTSHIRLLQDYIDEVTISEVPDLTRDQMWNLNEFLKWQVNTYSMDPINLETRRTIGVLVSELVSLNLPGCSTRLFGSSIHGLGLKNSDVNIDLQVPEGSLPPEMLKQVAALLRKSPNFVDVVENFHCEFPFISFKYKKSEEICSISLNNERAVSLAILLSKYTPLDPRLVQLATLFRLWGQMTGTDKVQDGTWPGYAFYLLTIFYLQNCPDPVLPVLNDFVPKSDDPETTNSSKVLSLDIGEIKQKWSTKNKQTLAQLWLGMLRFYTLDFNYSEFMVCIDSSVLKPRKTRKLFIVDPFLPTRNVARSTSSNASFYYIVGCLMTTCKYYCVPQAKFGPLFKDIYVPASKYHPELEKIFQNHDRINSHLIHLIMKLDPAFHLQRGDIQQSISDVMHLMQNHDFQNVDNIPISYLEKNCIPPRQLYGKMSVSPKDARQLVSLFSPKFVDYNLVPEYFTGGEKVPKICSVCKREGHLKDDCPEEKLPPLDPLPVRELEDMQVLDKLCHFIFDKWKQNDEDANKRERICKELQEFIGDVHPTVKLELFGSTKNGFGLKGSDLDICLTFEDNKSGEGLDTRGFIEVLYRLLKTFRDLQDLLPIATAKVPILKFTHKTTKLDGDISLYNVLALENSKLLCTYAKIDERARVLGYMMKRFSKVCHIGDASKGSLSSYAYTLLVIFFLQRCDPPVLPVLQELTEDGKTTPIHLVEGCNAYFFSDLSKLDGVWPGKNKNKQSVGELWLDLLIFYTEKFDMLNNVICIRCSRIVTKFEKLWISNGIAIEDPFDLSHNLGSALTRKMYLYIVKALRKGRNHFAKPVRNKIRDSRDIEAYFMNAKELTDGDPPNDRGCRVCQSIGHKERECPQKKKKKSPKGIKKKNKSEIETPKNARLSDNDNDEDQDPDGFSDSDNRSSEPEEDSHLRGLQNHINQVPLKSNLNASVNQNRNITSNIRDKTPKPSQAEWQTVGFQQLVPPGFIVQDPNRVSGPHTMQRPLNPNQNTSASPDVNKCVHNLVFSDMITNNATKIFVPVCDTISTENLDQTKAIPVGPTCWSLPISLPGQETSKPPPGFIPISQGPQFANSSFPLDQNTQGQRRRLVVQNLPKFQCVPINQRMLGHHNVPVHPPPPAMGVTPRPTIGPAFANPQVVGMLGATEQLIWGQPIHRPSPFPSQMPQSPTLCDMALANMHISTQKDLSKNENNIDPTQSKHSQSPHLTTNSSMLNNTT